MTDSTPQLTPARFPTFKRIAAFFGWKFWRRCLLGLAVLVTITGLFFAEENVRGKRAWEKYRAEQEAKGVKFDLMAYVPPRVPDEQNFAMTPFLAPLYDFSPGTQNHRDTNGFARAQEFGKDLRLDTAKLTNWRKGERADLDKWWAEFNGSTNGAGKDANVSATNHLSRAELSAKALAAIQPYAAVLDEIATASKRPHARYNIFYAYENPAGILLPHLSVVRRLCDIFVLRADAELTLGQTEQAFNDIKLAIYLADTIKDEPTLISQLVRSVCLNTAMQVLWEGLADHRWTEAQLTEMQNRLTGMNVLAEYVAAMNGGERIGMGHGIFEYIRKNPGMMSNLAGAEGPPSEMPWTLYRLVPTGWFYFEEVRYHQLFEQYGLPGTDAAARRVQPKLINENGAGLTEVLSSHPFAMVMDHRVLSAMLLPAVINVHKKGAASQCAVDEAMIACALERFRLKNGTYPEALDALMPGVLKQMPHDVISGQPLKYQRTADGSFALYSVGWNEKDDGGAVGLKDVTSNLEIEKGDWVWRYPLR